MLIFKIEVSSKYQKPTQYCNIEAHPEFPKTTKMENVAMKTTWLQPLSIFAKFCTLDVCRSLG